jgi:AbrB family looped-hinge helix DNA binding protein
MPAATLNEKGQIVIPAEIHERYQLTPGTQVEFANDGRIRDDQGQAAARAQGRAQAVGLRPRGAAHGPHPTLAGERVPSRRI